MNAFKEKSVSMPVGVVVRRRPAQSRWAKWVWQAIGVLPGAAPAQWTVIAEDADTTDFHAATVDLELHRAETEAYRVGLSNAPPTVWVILRP